jgi:hypothetical protein
MGNSAPRSKGFSFHYPHHEKNEYQCDCNNRKYLRTSGYHERAPIGQ